MKELLRKNVQNLLTNYGGKMKNIDSKKIKIKKIKTKKKLQTI